MWHEGSVTVDNVLYHYYVKSYELPSNFGINHGKISKLEIYKENEILVVNYDRGWLARPVSETENAIFKMLKLLYN